MAARPPEFGRSCQTVKPQRRAEGAGLDGEGASRAILNVSAMRVILEHCPKDQVPDFTSHPSEMAHQTKQ
jgi:hypothetical protein